VGQSDPGMPVSRPDRRGSDEDGFILFITAMSMLVLLAFTAVALDLGALVNARRQDQTAADAAALAAAQSIGKGDGSAVLTAVDTYASETLGVATGTLDWNDPSCVADSQKLANTLVVAGAPKSCITFQGKVVRVKIPERELAAFFGSAVGEDSYAHTAFAIAGRTRIASVLPFALFATGASQVCLRSDNPSSPLTGCSGTHTGDSGLLSFDFFGDPLLGTTQECGGNGSGPAARLANNIAVGIDHDLERRPSGSAILYDDTVKCADATK
jgi:hypothetical protein